MIEYQEIYTKYESLISSKESMQKDLRIKKISLKKYSRRIRDYNEAILILTEYTKAVQKNVIKFIEYVVSTSIQIVFQENFKFYLKFEEKRNVPTYKPLISDGKYLYDPKFDKGGCMMDTIGISSRFALWAIKKPRSRNLFLLDEPFRFSGEFASRVAKYLKVLSQKLNFQILITTHNPDEIGIMSICDRVWKTTIKNKISKLRRLK